MENLIDMVEWSAADLYALSRAELDALQLKAARERFETLVTQIPVLKMLADKQGVTAIRTLDDICLILFKHTALKSYSLNILEDNRFDRLTAWLDKLTTHDLSGLDASGIESIDDWLLWLDENSPMRISHSSGTSGKLSFFPRSNREAPLQARAFLKLFEGVGEEPAAPMVPIPDDIVLVYLGYRRDYLANRRVLDEFVRLAGDEDRCFTLFPGVMSADVLSLQGRMRAAEAAGRLGEMKINPRLIARRDDLLANQSHRRDYVRALVERYVRDYRDHRAIVFGTWASYLELKNVCEELGVDRLFSPESFVGGGGGTKGAQLPDDYQEQVRRFLHVEKLPQYYGMTELNAWMRQCPHDHYHFPPFTIPYVLDTETGEAFPRTGRQSGRLAFFDLLAETYWGGCVTGDQVTIEWDQPCGCGRGQPYIMPPIQRISEKTGTDDKVSCSGAPRAHDDALNFLAGLSAG